MMLRNNDDGEDDSAIDSDDLARWRQLAPFTVEELTKSDGSIVSPAPLTETITTNTVIIPPLKAYRVAFVFNQYRRRDDVTFDFFVGGGDPVRVQLLDKARADRFERQINETFNRR
jgi:hypothetical protein